ncbi:hypothetical protein KCU65_g3003, partial [Aureobasidium melanogenum]
MDINSTASGECYPGGIPKDAGHWEAYILNQQDMFGGSANSPLSRRRKTVVGIPSFGEFSRKYEDRANEQRRRTTARKDSHQTPGDDKDELSHDNMHFGNDFLPHSFSSTASSTYTKHSSPRMPMSKKQFTPGSRHSRHGSASRPKLPESFMSAPDLPRSDSPETFKRKIHEHKAKFNASQKQRSHSRPRHKSLLSSRLYEHPPQPVPVPPTQPSADANGQPVTMYALWRQDCDEQLKDKSLMSHVPVPPVSTCSECSNASILGGQPVPIACGHSLDKVLRTGVTERAGSFAFSKAYFAILKSERQRWHTDRFGACNPSVKSRIVTDAQLLFILINDLFEIEKLRLVETAEMIPEHVPAHEPCHTPDYFKFRPDERHAW